MIDEKFKSSVQLKGIHLLTSVFKKSKTVNKMSGFEMNIKKKSEQNQQNITCELTISLSSKTNPDFQFEVSMLGTFLLKGELHFSIENFKNMNAPAIIYPYIRQHVRSVSLEAGLSPIILPVINFEAFHQQKQNKK